jgi:hypothetical protein
MDHTTLIFLGTCASMYLIAAIPDISKWIEQKLNKITLKGSKSKWKN